MFPSCEGLFVIFALPSSVSIIAPLTKMFCLARKVFEGVSMTFFIVVFFVLFFAIMFTMLLKKDIIFFEPPRVLSILVFLSPIFTILAWFCLLVSFLFFGFLYLPPLVFLLDFIKLNENFGLNMFALNFLYKFRVPFFTIILQ